MTMFIDKVKLKLQAGNGGRGIVSFLRQKYQPLGGPDGGDGGDGGSIFFTVDTNKSTLLDLTYNKLIVAKNGANGKNKCMHGEKARDVIVKVPLGTLIKDAVSNEIIADLDREGKSALICQGGKGGKGNYHFASARNSAPNYAKLGTNGEVKEVIAELKLLADVGLVGLPSVGKSTLLSVVSAARPLIAAYHFTTLKPQLGVCALPDGSSFVMADLPGLIEGAAEGKGLGHEFLKHLERCRVIMHIIDMGAEENRDPLTDYEIIKAELAKYPADLQKRPQLVLANKMDLPAAAANLARFKAHYPQLEVFPISTLMREGLKPVLYRAKELLATTPPFALYDQAVADHTFVYKYRNQADDFQVYNEGNGIFRLEGTLIEKLFRNLNFDNEDSVLYFSRMLSKLKVDDALRAKGCKNGDQVFIKDYSFDFLDKE